MTALPYGLRDVKITPYTDAGATTLDTTSIDLPNARTFSFTEAEEFETLRGDDKNVTTRGKGPEVEWELEAGGLDFDAVSAIFGAEIVEEGVSPATTRRLRKKTTDARPFFKVEGQAISDSGGDVHCVLPLCRATGDFEGEFADGQFFLTSGSGSALGSRESGEDADLIYEFVENTTVTNIT